MSGFSSAVHPPISHLSLVTLYVTDRCNSRCRSCDYWRHGGTHLSPDAVRRLLPSLEALGTRIVQLSGGEPLMSPDWPEIAAMLRAAGLEVWLLTAGLALAKSARKVCDLIDSVTVSLDGADAATYAAIRGLDAFDKVCEGIRAVAALGLPPALRVTVQRDNFRQLPAFVSLAKDLGARSVSFLAVDVANPHAFGRTGDAISDLALRREDLPEFEQVLSSLDKRHARDFRTGFIAESSSKLRRLHRYFSALHGSGPFPAVRCNAPEFSAVVGAKGEVQPCFFIAGPPEPHAPGGDLEAVLNGAAMRALRTDIRAGRRPECRTCVCSMYRPGGQLLSRAPTARASGPGAASRLGSIAP
ncbi:MAG TPA: radical SAM protein [Steroidobacteraceae bacterium]|jgi:MoaA/NifB/PqqE/SkfB family radical SAM enzyme|nr:radical SAM protein [Steroidobacteraceae bacterium]